MANQPMIIVTVSPTGEVKVEATNVVGSGCQALTKGIEQALGATTGDKRKPEFLQSANQAAKATH